MSKNNKKVGPALRFKDKEGKAFPEWRVETLGAIAKFSKGKGISKADIDVDGDLECIRYGELYTEYNETISNVHSRTNLPASELVLSKKNDVIIPASGETQLDIATAACVLKDGVALGGDLNIIRTPENGVFLSYYLNSAKKHEIAALSQGISVVHLYAAQLSTVLIRLPVKEEQKKIASILTAIDNKIENLEQQLEALKAFKKGVMQGLFNFEEEHITPPNHVTLRIRFKDENGKEYPPWRERLLSELIYEKKERNRNMKYEREDVLSVSGELGIVNQMELLGRSYAGESVSQYHVVDTGDIVYTKSPLRANPYGIIKVNKGAPGIVSTLYAVYSCNEGVSGRYLDYYFQLDEHVNNYLRPLVHKGAKNDMKISNTRVLMNTIRIPSYAEQCRIVTFLSDFDKKIEAVEASLQLTSSYKKSLLQQLFN